MKKVIVALSGTVVGLLLGLIHITCELNALNDKYNQLDDEINYFLDVTLETDAYQDAVEAIVNDSIN